MTANPLFVADKDTLKGALGLAGVPDSASHATNLKIDEAITNVNLHFFRKLGRQRTITLQGYSAGSADIPADNHEFLRRLATQTEIDWVRLELTWMLPALFQSEAGGILDSFNNEAAFRKMDGDELSNLRIELARKINHSIDLLTGSESAGNEIQIRVNSIEPDLKPPGIGSSIQTNVEL